MSRHPAGGDRRSFPRCWRVVREHEALRAAARQPRPPRASHALPAVGRPANGGPGRALCCSQRPPATRRGRARAVRAALPRCNRRLAPLREPPRATPPLAVLALLPLTASARALVSRVLRVGFHPTSS